MFYEPFIFKLCYPSERKINSFGFTIVIRISRKNLKIHFGKIMQLCLISYHKYESRSVSKKIAFDIKNIHIIKQRSKKRSFVLTKFIRIYRTLNDATAYHTYIIHRQL